MQPEITTDAVSTQAPRSLTGRKVLFLLLAQILILATYLSIHAHLNRAPLTIDAVEYIELSRASFLDIIQSYRPPAFPLLLSTLRAIGFPPWTVSFVNLAAHLLATVVLHCGLLVYSNNPGAAAGAAAAFLYSILSSDLYRSVLTDSLARSFLVIAIALLLWLVTDLHKKTLWVALAAAVFFSAMLRVANILFVIALPVIGMLLYALRENSRVDRWVWIRTGGLLLAITLIPLLMYCGGRKVIVGGFGITANSAGFCLLGITAQMREPELIEQKLSPTWQPVAREVATARSAARLRGTHMRYGSETRINWNAWFNSYSPNLHTSARIVGEYYQIIPPGSYNYYARPPTQAEYYPSLLHTKMGGLGIAIIRANPELYAHYVIRSLQVFIGRMVTEAKAAQVLGVLLLVMYVSRVFIFAARGISRKRNAGIAPAVAATLPPR